MVMEQDILGRTGGRCAAGVAWGALGLWLTAALSLSLSGALQTPEGEPPMRVLAAASIPMLAFAA